MARAHRRAAARRRCGGSHARERGGAHAGRTWRVRRLAAFRRDGLTRVSLERRRVCGWLLLPAAQWFVAGRADAATVASARLWPAQEYTRLILDAPTPVAHQLLVMKNPDRLVLDLEGVELNSELGQLPQRVLPSDPYIQAIRVACRPGCCASPDLKTVIHSSR